MRELIVEVAEDMANHGLGVFGTSDPTLRTIYWGEMPATCVKGLLLIDTPGAPPQQYIDTEWLTLTVEAKAATSDEAKALLRAVYNTYNRRYDWETTNWHVYWSHALGSIVDSGRNVEGSKIFRLSVQFMCRNLNNVS
jgi:hypothetical protein